MFQLATLYESGEGGVQDITKALKWYRMAGKKGIKEAKEKARFLNKKLREENQN